MFSITSLNAKEIMDITHIFHGEGSAESSDQVINQRLSISSDENIINIHKQSKRPISLMIREQRWIIWTSFEAKIKKKVGKLV